MFSDTFPSKDDKDDKFGMLLGFQWLKKHLLFKFLAIFQDIPIADICIRLYPKKIHRYSSKIHHIHIHSCTWIRIYPQKIPPTIRLSHDYLMTQKTRAFPAGVWAMLWLVLTFVAWLGVTIHDLALIGQTQKVRCVHVRGQVSTSLQGDAPVS